MLFRTIYTCVASYLERYKEVQDVAMVTHTSPLLYYNFGQLQQSIKKKISLFETLHTCTEHFVHLRSKQTAPYCQSFHLESPKAQEIDDFHNT